MEEIIAYIVLAVFGFSAFYAYRYSRHRTKQLPLSSQIYTDCELKVFAYKQSGKFSVIHFRSLAKKDMQLINVRIELIDKNRSFQYVDLDDILENHRFPVNLSAGENFDIKASIKDFRTLINRTDIPYKTFRLVIETQNEKKFKSHKLAFNQSGVIYRPDSGKYN